MTFGTPTKLVSDVMRAVKRTFGDESGVQLDDTDIIGWINQAQSLIVTKNGILKARATTPLVAGTAKYTLSGVSPKIHQLDSVLIDGRRIGNMSVAQAEETISQTDPAGDATGDPAFWYEWAGELTFWPEPSASGTITVRYTAEPATVTSSSSVLSVPDDYFTEVVNYVLKQAYEMDEDWQASQAKSQEFESSLAERGEEERTAQSMTYETITIYDYDS